MVASHCNSFAVLTTLHFFSISAWCLNHFHFNPLQLPPPQLKALQLHSPSAHFLSKASSWDYIIPWASSFLWLYEFSFLGGGWEGRGRKSANSLNIAKKENLHCFMPSNQMPFPNVVLWSFLTSGHSFLDCVDLFPLPNAQHLVFFSLYHVCWNTFSFASAWKPRLMGCSFYCQCNHVACFIFHKGHLLEIRLLCFKAGNSISFYM